MEDSDDEMTSSSHHRGEVSQSARQRMLSNELRSFKNRGFHDGYDEGKKQVIQEAFDSGYQKAFEKNFALSTLKGVAQALRSSSNLRHHHHQDDHPRANISSPSRNSGAHHHTTNSPHRLGHHHHQKRPTSIASTASSSLSRTRSNPCEDATTTASCSSASSSASGSSCNVSSNHQAMGISSSNIVGSVNISDSHLSKLESMKFDNSSDIESIKEDLIKICRENRLEILAHYVSQIV